MTALPEYVYMLAEDLFRVGNSSTPRLNHVRPQDIDRFERNGITMVRSNGKGISLLSEKGLARLRGGGWLWKISRTTSLPSGLAISADPGNPGHFLLCPSVDMTVARYHALLSELALRCEKVRKA